MCLDGEITTLVATAVLAGSQWNSNDPSGEISLLSNFYGAMGGSSWLNGVTQYCEDVASGTVFCNGAGTAAGNAANNKAGGCAMIYP